MAGLHIIPGEANPMETHVKVLAILHLVFGALGVLGALVIMLVFGGLAGLAGTGAVNDPQAAAAAPFLGALGGFIAIAILVLSVPGIIAGYGLLQYFEWARILGIILSALNLLSFPFGTALGIYGLWVLLNQQTLPLFQRART